MIFCGGFLENLNSRFKSICKNWCNAISHSDFEELNVQQLMSKIRINVYSPQDAHRAYKCASFKLERKGLSAKQVTSFYLTPKLTVWIEDSFSNLLFCQARDPVGMPFEIDLCVFDTIIRELKHLPEINGCYDHTSRCSFICIESTSNISYHISVLRVTFFGSIVLLLQLE